MDSDQTDKEKLDIYRKAIGLQADVIARLMSILSEKVVCQRCEGKGFVVTDSRLTYGGYVPSREEKCTCDSGRDFSGLSDRNLDFCRLLFNSKDVLDEATRKVAL